MSKIISVLLLVLSTSCLHAQWGSIAVFETDAEQKVKIVRIFATKCTVTTMNEGYYSRIMESVNEYMHLDGKLVFTKFYIPFTGYDGAKEFALDEYISKKEARSVRFIKESEEILLDENGYVVSSKIIEKPLGCYIFYYHNGTEVNQWEVIEVWGKKLKDEEAIIKMGKSKAGIYTVTVVHEWKPGYNWDGAAKVAEKGSSKFAFRGVYSTYAVDQEGEQMLKSKNTPQTNYNAEQNTWKRADGEEIDYSKEDYVDNLPPKTINELKSYFKDVQQKLLADGWQRFTSKYEYAPYAYDQFNMGGRMDYAYTAILVSTDTNATGFVNEFSNGVQLLEQKLGPNKYAIYYDMESPSERRRFEAKVISTNGSKIPFGVIVFRRPVDFQKSIQAVLISANGGFTSLKNTPLHSENGKNIFSGRILLGHLFSNVSFNSSLNKWEYTVFCDYGGDDADKQNKMLMDFLTQKEKDGVYTLKKSQSDDKEEDIVEVYTAKGDLVLKTNYRSYRKKIKWIFYEN